MKKVLLIWPTIESGFLDLSFFKQFFGQKGQYLPLPLLCVASALGHEWEYQLVDEDVSPISLRIAKEADFFLISFNILLQQSSVERIVRFLRPFQKPIIIGGAVMASQPEIPDGVHAVIGEIEGVEETHQEFNKTVADILSQDMRLGTLKPLYRAASYPDVTTLPTPRYDLLDLSKYFSLAIQLSRGGWHRHDSLFGLTAQYGEKRLKTFPQIRDELELLLKEGGGKTIYIADDFLYRGEASENVYLLELFNTIGQWQKERLYPFDFFAKCDTKISDSERIVKAMLNAGINILYLRYIPENNSSVIDAVSRIEKLRSAGMGVILHLYLKDESGMIFHAQEIIRLSRVPIILFSLNDKNIQQPSSAYFQLIQNTYSPSEYFSRCRDWVAAWNDALVIPGQKGSIPGNLKIVRFFRSALRQGLFSSYRRAYLSYIIFIIMKFQSKKSKLSLSFYFSYLFSAFYQEARKIVKHSFES